MGTAMVNSKDILKEKEKGDGEERKKKSVRGSNRLRENCDGKEGEE